MFVRLIGKISTKNNWRIINNPSNLSFFADFCKYYPASSSIEQPVTDPYANVNGSGLNRAVSVAGISV